MPLNTIPILLSTEDDEYDEHCDPLPGFRPIILLILATLDDPDATNELLVKHIERNPLIARRVILLAKVLATRRRSRHAIADVAFATALLGINRTREITILSNIAQFIGDIAPASIAAPFWQHSVAVGVCSEQLALATTSPASASEALIAGLLHDIGQLWLYRFKEDAFRAAWRQDLNHSTGIEETERARFGVDHSTIGTWLAENWSLPQNIITAIRHHHAPDSALHEPLAPVVHVAEVLSNALGLTSEKESRVTTLSSAACHALGLTWDEYSRSLFVRMESRVKHANSFLPPPAPRPHATAPLAAQIPAPSAPHAVADGSLPPSRKLA